MSRETAGSPLYSALVDADHSNFSSSEEGIREGSGRASSFFPTPVGRGK